MLPLYLLTAAKTKQILIELKSGESLNGDLVNCDSWMNLTLSNVILTSPNGDAFMKIPEIYVRGTQIKYLRLPDDVMDKAKEQNLMNQENRNRNNPKRRGFNNSSNYNSNNNHQSNPNRRGRNPNDSSDGRRHHNLNHNLRNENHAHRQAA